MSTIRFGIRLESLGLPLRRGLFEAGRFGVAGVQLDAAGDLDPRVLSQTGRRELRHLLSSHNLDLAALGCPLRHGLDHAENQQPRLEHVKKVLDLSYELGPRRVVVQAGALPDDKDMERRRLMDEALRALGQHGDRTGTVLALETGHESGEAMKVYLDRFDCGSLAASYDPANLLVNRFDPYVSARALHGRIVHAVAKDARQTGASRTAQEVPLGHGDLDWLQLAGVFAEIDYRGWLTVAREMGDQRLADVAAGVSFLRRFIA
jgi:L-ribulose-5-phosphate 3-epimerase